MCSTKTDLLNSKKPVNQLLDQVVDVLSKYGLAYTSTLTPGLPLCHPQNRSKGMVNCLDMWGEGAKMLQVGMGRQPIGHSLAIEPAIDPVKRQDQFKCQFHVGPRGRWRVGTHHWPRTLLGIALVGTKFFHLWFFCLRPLKAGDHPLPILVRARYLLRFNPTKKHTSMMKESSR